MNAQEVAMRLTNAYCHEAKDPELSHWLNAYKKFYSEIIDDFQAKTNQYDND